MVKRKHCKNKKKIKKIDEKIRMETSSNQTRSSKMRILEQNEK